MIIISKPTPEMERSQVFSQILEGIEGVVFDFDGTLVDSLNSWRTVDIAFFERRKIAFDPDAYLEEIMGKSLYECAVYTIENYGLVGEKPQDIVEEWKHEYQEFFETVVEFFPGAEQFMQYLKESKIPYAVATAGLPSLCSFFDRHESVRPAAFVSCDDVGSSKPDPAVFREAIRRIGIPEERCIIFEDSKSGLQGARSTKCRVCGFLGYDSKYAPFCDFILSDWRDLFTK